MRISPKKALARLVTVLFTILMTAPLLTSSAQAEPDQTFLQRICPGDPYPEIEIVGGGLQSVVEGPSYFDESYDPDEGWAYMPLEATVYGQYGTAGLSWHYVSDHCFDGFTTMVPRWLANTMFDWTKGIGHTTIVVYQYALSDGFLHDIAGLFASVMEGMRDGIWRPLIPVMTILGAAWMAWVGLIKQRFTLSVQGAVWMISAITFGFWMLAHPLSLMNATTTFVNGITAGLSSVVAKGTEESMWGNGGGCPPAIYGDSEALDLESNMFSREKLDWESDNHYFIRLTSDTLHSELLCRPWGRGQFGPGYWGEGAFIHHGAEVFTSQSVSRIELEEVRDRVGSEQGEYYRTEIVAPKNAQYQEVHDFLQERDPTVYATFSGDRAWERSGVAFAALMANILVAAVVITISVALLVAKFCLLFAFLIFPIVGLIGIHPGYGRTVLRRWFELVLGLILKQVFMTLVVAIFVGMATVLFSRADLGRGILGMIVFLISLLVYRRHLSRIFAATDGASAVDRIASTATQVGPELRRASNAIPIIAYGRLQKWGWRNKAKIATVAAVGGGIASSQAAARAGAAPEDAPPLRGLKRRMSDYLERTAEPGARAADPPRPAHRPLPAAPEPATRPAPPLPAHPRRKGMLGGGGRNVPPPETPPADAPRPSTRAPQPLPDGPAPATAPAASSPSGRRPEDAPARPRPPRARPRLGSQWQPPGRLREAVPWSVPRKRPLPLRMFPFGDRRGK